MKPIIIKITDIYDKDGEMACKVYLNKNKPFEWSTKSTLKIFTHDGKYSIAIGCPQFSIAEPCVDQDYYWIMEN